MNVACDYEAPMQMLTTEKYIATRQAPDQVIKNSHTWTQPYCVYLIYCR